MNKSTWIAVLVFVALAAAAVVTLREKPERGITRISFAQVDPARVDRVLIKSPAEVELTRAGDEWKIGASRADGEAVARLLEVIAALESSELETNDPERYAAMEVDDAKGAAVQLFSGGQKVADFVVGGAATAGSHLRIGDAVYAVRGVSRAAFARDRSAWLERRLFFDKVEDVQRVEVALAGQPPYALVKDGATKWKLEDASALPPGQRFDAVAAGNLVRSLVTARAGEILEADPGDAAGFASGDTLRFSLAAGEPRILTLGAAQADGSVYARSSAREAVATLRTGAADGLRKRLADLRDMTLMSFDAGAAQKLAIAGGDGEVVFEKQAEGWKLLSSSAPPAADFALDEALVRRRLATLGGMRAVAEAAADAPGAAQLDASAQHVTVTAADGTAATLRFGAESKLNDQAVVLARGNADQGIYLVNVPARDQLLGGLETFRRRENAGANPLGGLDPAALQNLPPEVRDSVLKQLQEKAQRDAMMQKAIEAQKPQQ